MSEPSDDPATPRPSCRGLALLPNGEAVRPEEVRRVSIDAAPGLVQFGGERFCVSVELEDGTRRGIATGLSRTEAADLGRRCARAVNEALAASCRAG